MLKTTTTLEALLDAGRNEQTRQHSFGRDCRKLVANLILASGPGLMASALILPAAAQSAAIDAVSTAPENGANSNADTAQNIVRWNGSLPGAAGRTVTVRFALYQNQAGGLALWNETQSVKVGADGRYSVLLGVTSTEGLPQALFEGGVARWVEARPVTADADTASEELPRSLLAAVPYAFKAVDAETLAGRSSSDYLTREDLQSAVASGIQVAAQKNANSVSPALAGTGSTGALAFWSNSTTLGNSVINQSSSNYIGIGTASPATNLDVYGASTLRGSVNLPAASAATAATGIASPMLELSAVSYFAGLGPQLGSIPETFAWQAVPMNNNTSSPAASLDLLFASENGTPKATGLSIASNGQITFAFGQTFPLTGGITGVTAGAGLKGGGTSGAVSLSVDPTVIPTLAASNTFTGASNTFNGTGTFNGEFVALVANSSLAGVYCEHCKNTCRLFSV